VFYTNQVLLITSYTFFPFFLRNKHANKRILSTKIQLDCNYSGKLYECKNPFLFRNGFLNKDDVKFEIICSTLMCKQLKKERFSPLLAESLFLVIQVLISS